MNGFEFVFGDGPQGVETHAWLFKGGLFGQDINGFGTTAASASAGTAGFGHEAFFTISGCWLRLADI